MKGTYYWIKNSVRNAVAKRDKGICRHCGKKATKASINSRGVLVFHDKKGRIYHLDHIKLASEGGAHTEENLVLSCHSCNLGTRRKITANDIDVKSLIKEING